MPDTVTERYKKRLEKMRGMRMIWATHWQEILDYVLPNRAGITRTDAPGIKKGIQLFDTTAAQACELLAGALHGMLTNPSTRWFELTTGDDALDLKDDVRFWLQNCADTMHNTLNNSNFQTEVHELYLDLSSIGTSCMSVEEDDTSDVRFATRHIAEIFVDENNKGIIDSVYRVWKWTLRQLVQEFGVDALTKEMRDELKDNPDTEYEILHAVEPRDEAFLAEAKKVGKVGPKFKPFASITMILAKDHILEEGGFDTLPYVTPRWMKASGEVYGRSPSMKALPDIKMVNEMMKTTLKGAQKMVDPPLQMPDEGFIGPAKLTPGGVNYYRAGTQDRIEPLETGGKPDLGSQMIDRVRAQIRDDYYIDQLQLNQQGPQMTATEVNQRTQEKLRFMAPMLGRQQSEFLAPLIDRVFAILFKKRRFSQPPESLKRIAGKLQVKYSSQIARAQRSSEGNNVMNAINSLGPITQVDPTVMDNFDNDATARYIAMEVYGLPQKILRTQQAVKGLRQQRQKSQQQAQVQQQQQHEADLIQKAGPTLVQQQQMAQNQGV